MFPLLRLFAATATTLSVAACGSTGYNVFIAPGKFSLYDCTNLASQSAYYLSREKQLRVLMDNAEREPGGYLVSVAAYRGEYGEVQGNIKELRREIVEKSCTPRPPGLFSSLVE